MYKIITLTATILALCCNIALAAPNTTREFLTNGLTPCAANNTPIVSNGNGSQAICHTSGALGTAAFINTGTSGGTIGLLNAANTYSATQTFAAITATTINGNTFTTGTGVLTLGAGKTTTINNTLTFTGTDGSSVAFGAGGTVVYTSSYGSGVGTALGLATNANGGFPTYSSGAWTPVITTNGTVGTPVYSAQVGSYEIIGRTVNVRAAISLSSWGGSPTGNISITGLPVASTATANDYGGCHAYTFVVTGLAANNFSINGQIAPSTSAIIISQSGNTVTSPVTAAQFGGTGLIFLFCNYHT